MNNIILIGMMGTFKSSAGKIVSQALNIPYIDTDDEIEKQQGKTIAEIFSTLGEPFFRKIEEETGLLCAKKSNSIISCGGGMVLSDFAMNALRASGKVVLFTASAQTIFERIRKNASTRPLIDLDKEAEGIRVLYEKRKPLYLKYSDFIIDTDELTSNETAQRLMRALSANFV